MVSDANTTARSREQLSALAAHLGGQREAILQRWREATATVAELTIAASLTRVQFNDHIPGVLDSFALRLRAWPDEDNVRAQQNEKEQVNEHGLQRWQQGYQLRELTQEWGHLQMAVMDELEDHALAHPDLEPCVMPAARRAWARLCWDGISDSAAQYWRLHQAEANGHVRELEQAMATLNELDRARATTWREATHDLQGSLSVVTGATSVLDRQNVPEVTRHEFSDLLQRGVASLHDMLNDLMSLARLDAGLEQRKVVPFDAGVLLTDFCETSLPLAQERGLFLKMKGPDSLRVHGDRAKIQRILQNLLLNALKYTERGGVTVIWDSIESHDAHDWMFCVQDTGPGLDEGSDAPLARQLYEATQTAHAGDDLHEQEKSSGDLDHAPTVPAQSFTLPVSQQPGEGVGLSIVKRLCELLDASIELETSPGAGSTFRVVLPRHYHKSSK
ncbi:MAG: HAMP domain-containing sensor histidine kinase [Prosthecobacter sp.]|nr:HAMP domain-containing sensor histidine kinase [Prosthecobacter sp.]